MLCIRQMNFQNILYAAGAQTDRNGSKIGADSVKIFQFNGTGKNFMLIVQNCTDNFTGGRGYAEFCASFPAFRL